MASISHDDTNAVVIIGSGAGGGTLAHELTRRGIKVVLLEAGARQSLASFSQVPGEAFAQLTWLEPRTQSGTTTVVEDYPTLPSWTAKTVGGTTVHWTGMAAACPRPWEMRARTTYGAIDGASLIDWPLDYQELLHYYQLAEKRMVVTRRNGNPGLPASNHFKVFHNGAKRIGYKQVHTGYMAINTRPADDRGMCIQQGFCVQGCKTGAKWSTLYTEIPRAEATGNLDLRAECRALRIEHGADGRVTGVVYRDPPATSSARRRASSAWPAMRSRPRGCCCCRSPRSFPTDLRTPVTRSAAISATTPAALSGECSTSRSTSGAARRWPASFWTRPGTTRSAASPAAITSRWRRSTCRASRWPGFPQTLWGRELGFVMEHYRSMAGIYINGEDLPRATNRITLNPEVKDQFGLPVANIHVDDHPNNAAMRRHGQQQGEGAVRSRRCHQGGDVTTDPGNAQHVRGAHEP